MPTDRPADTRDAAYTDRLTRLESVWWKRMLDVQRPYRWNLRRLGLGFTLDVGCGLGRNLANLEGNGVGVDHNEESVRTARERGFRAFTPQEFRASEYAVPGRFDTMLLAHVAEHMPEEDGVALLREYLGFVRPGGRIVLICPQELGYTKDATHVRFLDLGAMQRLCEQVGATVERSYSFPFPHIAGRVFPYNEFVVVASVSR